MMMTTTSETGETNVVRLAKGEGKAKREVYFRITKHEGGRVTAEISRSIVWKPIGGLKAAQNQMAKLRDEGFDVVAAA